MGPSLAAFQSYHMVSLVSILVGLSFLFETYTSQSASFIGPISLATILPLPFDGIHIWGFCFFVGGLGILLSPKPVIRAIFLVGGAFSWMLYASASLYESLWGPSADRTGSFAGIVLMGFVLRFFVALQHLTDSPSHGKVDA